MLVIPFQPQRSTEVKKVDRNEQESPLSFFLFIIVFDYLLNCQHSKKYLEEKILTIPHLFWVFLLLGITSNTYKQYFSLKVSATDLLEKFLKFCLIYKKEDFALLINLWVEVNSGSSFFGQNRLLSFSKIPETTATSCCLFRMTLHAVMKQWAVCNQHNLFYRLRNQPRTVKGTCRTTRKVNNS